jgi:hypothetical protein
MGLTQNCDPRPAYGSEAGALGATHPAQEIPCETAYNTALLRVKFAARCFSTQEGPTGYRVGC